VMASLVRQESTGLNTTWSNNQSVTPADPWWNLRDTLLHTSARHVSVSDPRVPTSYVFVPWPESAVTVLISGLAFPEIPESKWRSTGATVYCVRRAPVEVGYEPMLSPAEAIARIRSVFNLNMSETARALGVERPTVYAWLTGGVRPQPRNIRRLARLVSLARRWRSASEVLREVVHAPTRLGDSIVDLLNRDPLPEDSLQHILTEAVLTHAARSQSLERAERPLSAREAVTRYGIANVMDQQSEVDRLTGKRLTPEEE
jgi:transcriptional regulator with XRE-family HTH domain